MVLKIFNQKEMDWLELVIDLTKSLIPSHPVTNFEIQKYYQNEPRFNGVYSRDNVPNKINDWRYIINLDEYCDTGTHWTALFALNKSVTYFDSFGVEKIPKETEKSIKGSSISKKTFTEYKHMIR